MLSTSLLLSLLFVVVCCCLCCYFVKIIVGGVRTAKHPSAYFPALTLGAPSLDLLCAVLLSHHFPFSFRVCLPSLCDNFAESSPAAEISPSWRLSRGSSRCWGSCTRPR